MLFAGYWFIRDSEEPDRRSVVKGLGVQLQRWIVGLLVTSLLAGLATGLFAAYHFHRVAPFGLLANLLAVPVFSFIVMPSGFLGMVLMPFGYEALAFKLMAWGIEAVVAIADWVSASASPFGTIGMLENVGFLMLALCLLLVSVMKSQLRLFLIPLSVLGFMFLKHDRPPDILIAEDGKTILVRGIDGEILVSGARAGKFELSVWERALGIVPANVEGKRQWQNNTACDEYGCVIHAPDILIAHVKHPAGFYEDCRRADLIVTELSAPNFCRENTLVVDRAQLKSSGAHTLYVHWNAGNSNARFQIETAVPALRRPWHRHYPAPKNRDKARILD